MDAKQADNVAKRPKRKKKAPRKFRQSDKRKLTGARLLFHANFFFGNSPNLLCVL